MNHSCGKEITVYVPKGYDYQPRQVKCGSTSWSGGINQCNDCFKRKPMPEPLDDESDMEYDERVNRGD